MIGSIRQAWNRFFFESERPTPIALFRIAYGLLMLFSIVLMQPDWLTWFGNKGVFPFQTFLDTVPPPRIDLFMWLPPGNAWLWAYYDLLLISLVFLTLGLFTRPAAIMTALLTISMHHRNPYVFNSGDSLLRLLGIFLIFSSAGRALSLDRLWRVLKGQEGPELPLCAPWAQRLIQLQLSVVYLAAVYSKLHGASWIHGTALYTVLQMDEFKRFPVPSFMTSYGASHLLTWGTLLVEFAMGTVVWIRRYRYPMLTIGLLFHLGIEYSMNIFIFQWAMMITYITYLSPETLTQARVAIAKFAARWLPAPLTGTYQPGCEYCVRWVNVLKVLDVLDRIQWEEVASSLEEPVKFISSTGGPIQGHEATRALSAQIPFLWVVLPFLYLPGSRNLAKKHA